MLEEAQRRYQLDAIFHARVKVTHRTLEAEGSAIPAKTIASVLHAADPLFGDPGLHRTLIHQAAQIRRYPPFWGDGVA